MDQLLAKLTNLGYEVLGIFLPGAIFLLVLLFWWWAIGPLASPLLFGYFPVARLAEISDLLGLLNEEVRIGLLFGLLVAAYFSGHLLHWSSRSGTKYSSEPGAKVRVPECLNLQVPKLSYSFDPYLQPLFDEAKSYLKMDSAATWLQYYPVAKAFLAQNLQTSLGPTFQNKYTLHRSITGAAALWFHLTWATCWFAITWILFGHPESPKWIPLVLALPVSTLIVWGFSDSYLYNWKLWGNTLITEVYMMSKKPS